MAKAKLNAFCGQQASMLGLFRVSVTVGSSVVEWLACWTQAQKGPGSVLG